MATRCKAEYAYTTDDSTVDLRCVHDAGHDFDHLFMVRWESGDPS